MNLQEAFDKECTYHIKKGRVISDIIQKAFDTLNQKVSVLGFIDCSVLISYDESWLTIHLKFPNEWLLIIHQPYEGELYGYSQQECELVVFSLFQKRKLVVANHLPLNDLIAGIQSFFTKESN